MGVAAAGNLYYSGMNPSSGTAVFPPPSSTFGLTGVSSDNFGRSTGFMDDVRGPYKSKISEGIRGNHPNFNASASSSVTPPNARHADGVAMMDATSFSYHVPSLMEVGVGPHGSAWSRPGEPIMIHDHNHLIHGNYLGQHFPPAAPPWLDQQLNNNNNDGHPTAWNQSLPMPYIQVPNVNGSSLESPSMGLQRYHDTSANRNGLRFPHPPPVNQQHHTYHHPALPMQGVRGHNINFYPPITATSLEFQPILHVVLQSPHRLVLRWVLGMLALHHQQASGFTDLIEESCMGQLLDIEVSPLWASFKLIDMRLDIEDMSYEASTQRLILYYTINDLLALGERIGNVSTGLSEETITTQLKTKSYLTPAAAINVEEAASDDQETDSCIICQDEFKDQEKIGVLRCEHEYHADCLKKWLLVKNVCPICKSEALTTGGRDA
ncbi:Zinc finger, RING-type [Sesbania bispinosa]|nr:Zinc finger, RING-type [Sesbania bispinosa]